jgi:hypothetical protein
LHLHQYYFKERGKTLTDIKKDFKKIARVINFYSMFFPALAALLKIFTPATLPVTRSEAHVFPPIFMPYE